MANSLLLLSECLDQIRQLSNDTSINTAIQDKKYMELAERMAAISRNANTCAGIFFDMYMASRPQDFSKPYTEQDESKDIGINNTGDSNEKNN